MAHPQLYIAVYLTCNSPSVHAALTAQSTKVPTFLQVCNNSQDVLIPGQQAPVWLTSSDQLAAQRLWPAAIRQWRPTAWKLAEQVFLSSPGLCLPAPGHTRYKHVLASVSALPQKCRDKIKKE